MPPLTYQERVLRLQTGPDYRQRLPVEKCGRVMAYIPPLVEGSLRMAIEGASVAHGRPPAWFQRASDIRFTGYDKQGDDTLIALEIPTIGEAAEELYRQRGLWETRPNPEDTGFEMLRRVVTEVADENGESPFYDRQLLNRFAKMRKVFGAEIQAIQLADSGKPTAVNRKVAETAARLGTITPPTWQVRVAGVLDMIRHSTRSFSVRIESGEEISGVMESTESERTLVGFFGKRVVVLGRAVYRPSGRLLRIDAMGLEDGTGAPAVFSKVPPPQTIRPPAASRMKLSDAGKRGVSAFFDTWPGDETDADFVALVRAVRCGGGSDR